VKWGQLQRYCNRHGYEITHSGGDKIIKAPKDRKPGRSRQQIRIGHTSTKNAGTELLRCYVSKLKNVFGITEEDVDNE
jgi:hypothetical protein